MATISAKDTFESEVFGPVSFACGTWRGFKRSATGRSLFVDEIWFNQVGVQELSLRPLVPEESEFSQVGE